MSLTRLLTCTRNWATPSPVTTPCKMSPGANVGVPPVPHVPKVVVPTTVFVGKMLPISSSRGIVNGLDDVPLKIENVLPVDFCVNKMSDVVGVELLGTMLMTN